MHIKRDLKIFKAAAQLSEEQLRSEIHRFLSMEHQAMPVKIQGRWRIRNNSNLFVYRKNRLTLANEYIKRNLAISNMMLKHKLPSWRRWPGTIFFFNRNVYRETKDGIFYSHTDPPIDN